MSKQSKSILYIREYFPGRSNPSASSWVLSQAQSIQNYGYYPVVISPTPVVPRMLLDRDSPKHAWRQTPSTRLENYLGVNVLRPGFLKLPSKRFLRYNMYVMSKVLEQASKGISHDIVHAHFGHAGVAALRLKEIYNKPLITSFYGYDLGSDLPKLMYGYRELASKGDLFLALSEDMKRDLVKAGFPEQKIAIHHLGVDVNRFKPPSSPHVSSQSVLTFLTVASFHERKGIHFVIEAFKRLKAMHPSLNVRLRVVGDGPYKQVLSGLIGNDPDMEMLNNFTATDPRKMVLDEMQNCDVFILTSKTMPDGDKEGTPVVLMEAQACSKACISTKHAGIPELVLDGQTGILTEEEDVDGIAQAMYFLAANEDKRTMFGRNAREHIVNNFNHLVQMDKLQNIYDEFLLDTKRI